MRPEILRGTKGDSPRGCCQTNANQSPFPQSARVSGREKAAPLCESGGASQLVAIAVLEVTLRWKVVVDRGVDGCELLQCPHAPKP